MTFDRRVADAIELIEFLCRHLGGSWSPMGRVRARILVTLVTVLCGALRVIAEQPVVPHSR